MATRGFVLVLLTTGLLFGCESKKKSGGTSSSSSSSSSSSKPSLPIGDSVLRIDSSLEDAVANRVEAAMNQDGVSKAFDSLFDAIADDPIVRTQGTAYFETLGADPKIAEPLAALLGKLSEDPAMLRAVQKLMAENPTATPDQIGDLMGQKFERTWDSPPVNAAWMESYNAFVAKLRTKIDFSPVSAGLARRLKFVDADTTRVGKWNKRIVELNGGTKPDAAKATQLYLDAAWSDERIEKFATKLAANPVIRRETSKAVVDLLAIKSLRDDFQAVAAKLASDPKAQQYAVDAMLVLLADRPDTKRVRETLTALLTAPVTVDALAGMMKKLMTNDDVIKVIDNWFLRLKADPTVSADFATFFDGW